MNKTQQKEAGIRALRENYFSTSTLNNISSLLELIWL